MDTLGLLFIGPHFDSEVASLAAQDDDTFVALADGTLCKVERGVIKEKHTIDSADILEMAVLGQSLLVLCRTRLVVLTTNLKKRTAEIALEDGAVCMVHPSTYLNKVLVGLACGRVELWNFATAKRIFAFNHWSSRPAVMAQSPVVDVLAVGFESGAVALFDARTDTCLFEVAVRAPVRALSFRTDAADKPHMAVGSGDGLVSVWNLETRRMDQLVDAHAAAVSSLFFVPGQPILVSAGGDNAIKSWIFEFEDCRLLKSRTGHAAPPSLVRFYDDYGLLSAGGDDKALRAHSLLKDAQSHEISQGSIESRARKAQVKPVDLKLPPITAMAFFTTKDLRWDNLVTAHRATAQARTWRIDNKTIGEHVLKAASPVTAVAMSPCGNFGLLGTAGGTVDAFNVQSGEKRKAFAVDGPVVGLAVDQFSKELLVVTEAGAVAVLDFCKATTKVLHSERLPAGVTCFAFKTDNGLAAVGLADRTIRIYDLEARRIVRQFAGHASAARDLAFSADGKWLISCAADATIRTWDLPSGLALDCMACAAEPTSVAFSPAGDLLVSTHAGDLAVHLWSNKTLLAPLRLDTHRAYGSLDASAKPCGIIELSSQPRSKWLTLFNLDAVKARNKPVLPAEGPQKAPFFLDMAVGASLAEKRTADDETKAAAEDAASLELEKRLHARDNEATMAYLLASGASRVHFEIASLAQADLRPFLAFLHAQMLTRQNYELVQTYLSLALTCHREMLHGAEFKDALTSIEATQREQWESLEALLQRSLCLTGFVRDRF